MKLKIAVISLLLLASCTSKLNKPEAPADLIPRDTMVMIFHDLTVLEGFAESKYQNVQNYRQMMRKSGDNLLRKRQISYARFDRSYAYYVSRQEELQGIYTEVLDSLNLEINRLRSDTNNRRQEEPLNPGPDAVTPFGRRAVN